MANISIILTVCVWCDRTCPSLCDGTRSCAGCSGRPSPGRSGWSCWRCGPCGARCPALRPAAPSSPGRTSCRWRRTSAGWFGLSATPARRRDNLALDTAHILPLIFHQSILYFNSFNFTHKSFYGSERARDSEAGAAPGDNRGLIIIA